MTGTLKVTTSDLISASSGFDGDRGKIASLIQAMNSEVSGLDSVWMGDAQTAYKTSFNGLQDDIQTLDRKIKEHVTDLVEMARVYDAAEQKTQDANAALPKDAII